MMKVSTALFQLKVFVSGVPVQEYHKDGNTFIEGRKGSNYALQIVNLTPRRLLVHPTVDGLSAMTGKEASREDSSHGYVLPPFAAGTIPGWRLNTDEVANFFFAGSGKSYAEKTGSGENKGVIACAVWEEKTEFATRGRMLLSADSGPRVNSGGYKHKGSNATQSWCADSEPVASACAASEDFSEEKTASVLRSCNLGTGFGRVASHSVTLTSFVPASVEPVAIVVIYYDDIQGLKTRGIKLSERTTGSQLPNPFPKTITGCIPPKSWGR